MAQLQFGVIGHKGRMGQALEAAIADAGHTLFAGVDAGGSIGPFASQCDVLVDFSAPDALAANLGAARVAGKPIVVGTTGLEEEHFVLLAEAARAVPVLQSGNFSLGVTLLAHLVQEAAARLGDDWDIEVLEMHHRMKVDAPSGTAKLLGEAAAKGECAGAADAGANGDAGTDLPVTATYVVAQDGIVAWAFVEADYRRRAEPADVLGAVRALGEAGPSGTR